MLKIAWRGVVHNPARYIATLVAIVTGVAFFAAAGFVSDRVIDALEGDVNRQYGNVDAAITPAESSSNDVIEEQHRIPGEDAESIFSADGVSGSAGIVTGAVAFLANDGSTYGNDATGRLWIEDDLLNPLDLDEGSPPTTTGQIVVDRGLADRNDLEVDERVTLLTLAGQAEVEIVGISRFGSSEALDTNGTVSLSSADAFNWLTSGVVEYEAIYLRSDLAQSDLVAEIQPLVPAGFQVQSGDEFLQEQRDALGAPARYFGIALRAFAVLAMIVGGFVIYNTFNVIVTQRVRELAVMAAIGATPRQIMMSLLYEGLVIGLLGSALGVVAGFGMAFVLILVLDELGISLAGSGVRIGVSNVIGGLVLGTVITVVSVMIPARRAARTDPIEALRSAAVESKPMSRRRVIVTSVLVGLGAIGLLLGGSWQFIALGGFAFFVGVFVAGPILAVAGAWLARPVMNRLGLEGRLAVDNSARNPQRTATTSNALLIGVFLVTFVLVAGTSLKDFVVDEIRQLEAADFLIESTGGTIDDTLIADLQAIDGVEAVVPFRREYVTVNDAPALLSTGDVPTMREIARFETSAGSLDDLRPGTIAVVDDPTREDDPQVGASVVVATSNGRTATLEVIAVIDQSIDAFSTGDLVAVETFDALVGQTAPTLAFIDIASGDQTETTDAIKAQTSLRPDITLTEGNALGELIGSVFDFIINAVNGLLGMSIVIALIGIINTLSLSIIERRRELGLLRAVGMTDARVQNMVRLESVLIASLGTLTGMLLGLFFGWALLLAINRLADAGISLGLPLWWLLAIIILGPLLGLLASLIPAWRSTKLDVLDSLAAT